MDEKEKEAERHYIFENGEPKVVDIGTWSDWLDTNPRREIKKTQIDPSVSVISVFLPLCWLEPQADGSIKKLFFGTMVFGSPMHQHEEMNVTQKETEATHDRLVKQVKAILTGDEDSPECCKENARDR